MWWVFPALATRCADRSSASQRSIHGVSLGPTGADLESSLEGVAYLRQHSLRDGLLESFDIVCKAMSRHTRRAPFALLDAPIGNRQADGEWISGPLYSYRLFCSATLFGGIAHVIGDSELRKAALGVLRFFRPSDEMYYRSGGIGTAGFTESADDRNTPLWDADWGTLSLISRTTDWPAALEMRTAGPGNADAVFEAIDVNHSGTIERDELLTHLLRAGQEADDIAELFAVLDSNDDGVISHTEWVNGFTAYLGLAHKAQPQADSCE